MALKTTNRQLTTDYQMFCPKCGNADQTPETYCRQCGIFLPDIDKATKNETPPETHLLVNSVLSVFSIVVSLALAFTLYSMNIRLADSEVIIFIVAGFLLAMAIWQVTILYRTSQVKKFIKKNKREPPSLAQPESVRLNPADFSDSVPASVTDRTTRQLSETKRSTQAED